MGKHRPVWGFDKPNSDKSRFKLSKHRTWGFDKPQGRRGPISTSQHRIPWQEAHPRHLRLPGMSPQVSGHRNLLLPHEVPEMPEEHVNQSHSNLSGVSTQSTPLPLNFSPQQHVPQPQDPLTGEVSNPETPIEENGDYTVVNPIKNVKQGRKRNITIEAGRWFFLAKIYSAGKKTMAEIELDDMTDATVPVDALQGNVALR
jgi:hypothetical protein